MTTCYGVLTFVGHFGIVTDNISNIVQHIYKTYEPPGSNNLAKSRDLLSYPI